MSITKNMELTLEPSAEKIPNSLLAESTLNVQGNEFEGLMRNEELSEKLENILLERIKDGVDEALFQLGQIYFEKGDYNKAITYFERAGDIGDVQAQFQLGVMYYDGLGCIADHRKAVDLMVQVTETRSQQARHMLRAAQYNIGRAYFQGYGVRQSDKEAKRFWVLSADDGNPNASIKAQSMLGMYYCRDETKDLKRAFFWHSEACGNGSLESQGALGSMYQRGLGVRQDTHSAFVCFRQASERGNVSSMGNLVAYYYDHKLFTKAVELASRVSMYDFPEKIGEDTDCLPSYVAKGIGMACFYYARCLHLGRGIPKNEEEAKFFYSRSYQFDPDVCAYLQNKVTQQKV